MTTTIGKLPSALDGVPSSSPRYFDTFSGSLVLKPGSFWRFTPETFERKFRASLTDVALTYLPSQSVIDSVVYNRPESGLGRFTMRLDFEVVAPDGATFGLQCSHLFLALVAEKMAATCYFVPSFSGFVRQEFEECILDIRGGEA